MESDNPAPDKAVSPEQFLRLVDDAEPGWSDRFGGPTGIAAECGRLQAELMAQSERIAQIRAAALQELLKTRSGTQVAAMFGVSKNAIGKASKANAWKDAKW